MPLPEPPRAIPEISRNDLAHLQLEIARHADQLPSRGRADRGADLARWLQAEEKVFSRHARQPANVTDP